MRMPEDDLSIAGRDGEGQAGGQARSARGKPLMQDLRIMLWSVFT